jgi:hypothetical protein
VVIRRTFPGNTTLAVKVPDYIEVRRTLAIPAGGDADFGDVVMVPSMRVRGRVLDPKGRPVPNAEVTAWYPDGVASVAKSDLAGAFELRDLAPGDVTIEVHDAGSGGKDFALGTWKWRLFAGMPPIEVSMQPGGAVRVRVLDPKGLPVTVAHVSCEPPKSKYRPVPRSLDPAEEPGEFTGLRMPGPMIVQVLDPDSPNRRTVLASAPVTVREGKESFVEIRLTK